jgi:hypothetical protein
MNTFSHAMLVYQAGIANVFRTDHNAPELEGRNAVRLLQGDFRACEFFAKGLATAGVLVRAAHCNRAGDITDVDWSCTLEDALFFEKMCLGQLAA